MDDSVLRGSQRGDLVAVALDPTCGLGLASNQRSGAIATRDPVSALEALDRDHGPRWVWWGRETADLLAQRRAPIDRCWDVTSVHRLLFGGWTPSLGEIWATLRSLDLDTLPQMGQLDLLDAAIDEGDPDEPVRPDGHLRPEWITGGWQGHPQRLATWAGLALDAATTQLDLLRGLPDPARARMTAHAESAAELLCAEMANRGLPIDLDESLRVIEKAAGRRPASLEDEDAIRAERDEIVLTSISPRPNVNLRNPDEVKGMLRRAGLDLPDTRAWRLEQLRDESPLADALLSWRKDERIATTYGYQWLDDHVEGGRLRGDWTSSDGAAGRMTASAGLHNLPSVMRSIVRADSDHAFVRADLGQIEPRVLAAVSGDEALIAATWGDDLYEPIATRLGVTRDIAKLAVLGAMYGATTGESAHALAGLTNNYPVAMGLLEEAAERGRAGQEIFTSGGRRIRMWTEQGDGDLDRAVSVAASRGRFARNALIQGAAAEFFKVWAIIVRRRARELGAEVVLCLHDELLVHTPIGAVARVADIVHDAVGEAAHHWSPHPDVAYVADLSVIERWSEAK